jgi:sugar lactone lactonase YvrE
MRRATPFWRIFVLCLTSFSFAKSSPAPPAEKLAVSFPLDGPRAIALDGIGHLYIVEAQHNRVLQVKLDSGTVSVFAGDGKLCFDCAHNDGIPATQASLDSPTSLATDGSGNVYIGELAGDVRKVDIRSGIMTTIAGGDEPGSTTEGMPARATHFWSIDSMAFDSKGNLFVADQHQGKLFKIESRTGTVAVFAGNGKQAFSGDGGEARNASFRFPQSIAFDKAGDLLVADYGNCRIRRIERASGIISTIAVTGKVSLDGSCQVGANEPGPYPSSLALDAEGNTYFVEGSMEVVRRIDGRTLAVTTVAGVGKKGFNGDGGPAIRAQLNNPIGLAVDPSGSLYVSEFVNNRVRRVDARTRLITTVVGNGLPHRLDVIL